MANPAKISKVSTGLTVKPAKRTTRARMAQDMESPKIVKKLGFMPEIYREHYRKAMRGESLRSAVHSFCLECVGWQRMEVTKCTGVSCPLYPYRPYQNKEY